MIYLFPSIIYLIWVLSKTFSQKPGLNTWLMFAELHMVEMNDSFLSGKLISQTLLITKKSKRYFFDNILPSNILRLFIIDEKPTKLLSALMYATIAVEIVLPFALSTPKLWPTAVLVGVTMHLGFTVLFPATLLHFSILTIASYLTFIP